MNLIKLAIDRPIAVVAAVLMVVMFGYVALQAIPIQLSPDVNRPVITVETIWPGAAPAEVEREIINQQEEVLKGLDGLETITSRAEQGRGRITLEFSVAANMDRTLLLVANRLDRFSDYPEEADEPTLDTAGSEDSPIAWFILKRAEDNQAPIHTFGDFAEDVIKERLERVPGVSRVNIFGDSRREIWITIEPARLARYGLTVSQVLRALRSANASMSAGDVDEGKRRYVVRTEGELNSLEAIRQVVLRSEGDQVSGRMARVTVGDIARVEFGYPDPTSSIRFLGESSGCAQCLERDRRQCDRNSCGASARPWPNSTPRLCRRQVSIFGMSMMRRSISTLLSSWFARISGSAARWPPWFCCSSCDPCERRPSSAWRSRYRSSVPSSPWPPWDGPSM